MSKQKWRCSICSHEYESPIAVSEALCPNNHVNPGRGRSGRGRMELIEGALPRKKKATSGNPQH